MIKIPRSITSLLPKLSRENKSNMLNSLMQQKDINFKWQNELQQQISDNNRNKVPSNEYMYLVDAWDDARQVNIEIKEDIAEVRNSIRKDDNINKGGKRKRRSTKKSKKNKRKTRRNRRNRIKGGVTPQEAVVMQNRVAQLEYDATQIENVIKNINNGNRAFQLESDPERMYMKDEIQLLLQDEKTDLLRRLRPIIREQGRLATTLIINGYETGV